MPGNEAKQLEDARQVLHEALIKLAARLVTDSKAGSRFEVTGYAENITKLQNAIDAIDRAIAQENAGTSE